MPRSAVHEDRGSARGYDARTRSPSDRGRGDAERAREPGSVVRAHEARAPTPYERTPVMSRVDGLSEAELLSPSRRQRTPIRSTTKMRVSPGLMRGPAPRLP
ncbi:hypothetical protein GCM10009560_00550 [Nonomuraea longicatena]|uniref:Uncharacterized protein n=1 Tax=Nonomuraea longicatena TaxID=83682 RepID=A0ABN1NLA8_9ACTN